MTTVKEQQAASNGAKTRKSPTYKLSPDQLTQQVISLETKDLQSIQKAITEELLKRKEDLQNKLAELEGK